MRLLPLILLSFFFIIVNASVNPCLPNPCFNGGVCINQGGGNFTCNCTGTQYGGSDCTYPICDSPCSNGFTCENGGHDNPICVCNFDTTDQCYFFGTFYSTFSNFGTYPDYSDGNTAPCNFIGIVCNNHTMGDTSPIMTEIHWSGYGMTGTFQPNFAEMMPVISKIDVIGSDFTGNINDFTNGWTTNLKQLSLSGSGISGQIQSGMASSWVNMEVLELDNTIMFYFLPDEIGLWTHMKYFALRNNARTGGGIPTTVGNWVYSFNGFEIINCPGFESEIPTEIGNWGPSFDSFILENVPLIGGTIPTEIGLLSGLSYFELDGVSGLGGTLPPQMINCGGIHSFILNNCQSIGGSLPIAITPGWFNLVSLQVTNMPLIQGPFPPSGSWTSLVNLDFQNLASMSMQIPTEIGLWSSIQTFTLSGMPLITGTIPTQISGMASTLTSFALDCGDGNGNLVYTQEIDQCANAFEALVSEGPHGTLPTQFGNLHQVTSLRLAALPLITGSILEEFGSMSALIDFAFVNIPKITGYFPSSLWHLTNLQTLQLQPHAPIMGAIPTSWDSNLVSLSITDCYQTWESIPTEIFSLPSLTSLEIANMNLMSGSIGSEIGLATSLISIKIANTSISGSIPTELGLLTNLQKFSFTNNHRINGSIPTEIGNLVNMALFFVQNSTLMGGSIPTEIGNWLNPLEFKIGGSTGFTGTIPTDIVNWSHPLYVFEIAGTSISGTIPLTDFWFSSSMNSIIFDNSPLLEGYLPSVRIQANANSDAGCQFISRGCPLLEFLTVAVAISAGCTIELNAITYNEQPNPPNMYGFDSVRLIETFIGGPLSFSAFHMPDTVVEFEVGNCGFTGSLPEDFNSNVFQELKIYGNVFSGSIPDTYVSQSNLRILDLHNNGIDGTIPSLIRLLTNLEKLDLSQNQLAQGNPAQPILLGMSTTYVNVSYNFYALGIDIFDCSLSTYDRPVLVLDISNNQFTGDIGSQMSGLNGCIREIHASRNLFNMNVTQGLLGNLPNVTFYDLTINRITEIAQNINGTQNTECMDTLLLQRGNPIFCPLGDYSGLAENTDYTTQGCSGCDNKICPGGGSCYQIINQQPHCTDGTCQ